MLAYDKKERKNTDSFEANVSELEPVTYAKHSALIEYKRDPSQKNLQELRAACSKT